MNRKRLSTRLGLSLMALLVMCMNVHCDDALTSGPSGGAGDLNATIDRIVQKIGLNGGTTPAIEEENYSGEGPVFETLPRWSYRGGV